MHTRSIVCVTFRAIHESGTLRNFLGPVRSGDFRALADWAGTYLPHLTIPDPRGLIRSVNSPVMFAHLRALFRRPRVFCRALGCGGHGRPTGTLRRRFGLRSGAAARALGVQRRAGPQNPRVKKFFALLQCRCIGVTPAFKLFTLWQPRYDSRRASSSHLCNNHGR